MNFLNTVVTALKALRRNPTRALLTTLGIVIGIAAVITMMEIGNGSKSSVRTTIEKMGANSGLILPGWLRRGGVSMGMGSRVSLTPADAEAVGRECPSILFYSPVVRASSQQLIFGNSNWVPQWITGVSPEFFLIRNWRIAQGRAFTREEVESNARVCVIGATVARELFGDVSPVDCELRIRDVAFRVVGVLHPKGSNMIGMDEDDILFAPWTTIRMRITGRRTGSATSTKSTPASKPSELYPATGVALYPEQDSSLTSDKLLIPKFTFIDQIVFSASSPAKVKQAEKEVTALLRERHRLRPMDEDDFRIHNSGEFMSMLNSTTLLMTNLLLGVALLSLLVGGVGIMNIMLVSVTERTREIGLRMAVGARSSDILKQFLVESIILCLAGGVIGILMGHGTAVLINKYLSWPIESSPGAVVAAVGVSVFVGVVFGFYPAWKASKLDPIDALRYE